MKAQVIIAAGGMGQRLGTALPKAQVSVAGKPLLVRTLAAFVPLDLMRTAIVVVPETHRSEFTDLLNAEFPGNAIQVIDGGVERQDSIRKGLAALDAETDICIIHDAARPFISAAVIQASIDAAVEHGAATVAIPSIDTILVDDGDGFLRETPDRHLLWACQTPQTFSVKLIRSAHDEARRRGIRATDDATLVRHCGRPVKFVPGSTRNLKITTPMDLLVAEAIIEKGLECE